MDGTSDSSLFEFESTVAQERAGVTAPTGLVFNRRASTERELGTRAATPPTAEPRFESALRSNPTVVVGDYLATTSTGSSEAVVGDHAKGPTETKESECDSLLGERRDSLRKIKEQLLRKKYGNDGELSLEDGRRLAYVVWQIDRIEYSRMADDLDDLNRLVTLHQQLGQKVEGFVEAVSQATAPRKRKRRQHGHGKR